MEQAIKKAIEGGYGEKTDYRPELKSYLDMVSYYGRRWPGHFLDPLFWQSLGKAMGWNKPCYSFGDNGCDIEMSSWQAEWHRFIDHLAEGKNVDDFFNELLK